MVRNTFIYHSKMSTWLKPSLLIFMGILMHQGQTCPEGWYTDEITMSNRHCYFYVPTPATYTDAKSSCTLEGGQLASPQTAIDIAILLQLIQVRVENAELRKDIWLEAKKEEGEWRNLDGRDAYLKWQEGYPEGNGECLVMFYAIGTMKNKGCHHKAAFVCRVPRDLTNSHETCEDPMLPDQMSIKLVGPATTGTVAYPMCEDGYIQDTTQPQGSSISCHGSPGSWHRLENLSQCHLERCPELELTHLEELSEGGVNYQTVRNFTCPQDSEFDPALNLTSLEYISVKCNREGQWEGENSRYLFDGSCVSTSQHQQKTTPVNAAADLRDHNMAQTKENRNKVNVLYSFNHTLNISSLLQKFQK